MSDLFLYLSLATNIFLVATTVFMKIRLVRFIEKESGLIVQLGQSASDLSTLKLKLEEANKEKGTWRDRTVEGSVRINNLEEQLKKLELNQQKITIEKEQIKDKKQQAEIQLEASRQKLNHMQKVMHDWEATKQQHMEAAKASVAAAGAQLSNKLLDDHKRENEETKRKNEELIQKTTEDLHKKFENVFFSMNSLHERIEKSKDTVDLIEQSLLSPAGAGALSEITLENIFKASGLVEKRDYIMQHWVESNDARSSGLRPDAIVFLPSNSAMVIDSKASKFFVEITKNSNDADKVEELEGGLKKTMNNHLNDLIKRDYESAVEKHMKKKGNKKTKITALMFLPTDAAIEKLNEVDPKFMEKAWKEHIIPVGPSGLVSALLQANLIITKGMQEENSKRIIDEVKVLIASVARLHNLADNIGKGLKTTMNKYDAFAASFNRNLIPKTRKLDHMGVSLPKNNKLKQLDRYQVSTDDLVEAEAIEAETQMVIETEVEALKDLAEVKD